MFELHPRLAADTTLIDDLPLCRLLLMNDARYPWLILVPRREDIREIHELDTADRRQLMVEMAAVSEALAASMPHDKINIGALGNLVPQLHIHVIARRSLDDAWPGPVWGVGKAVAYEEQEAQALIERLRPALQGALTEGA